MMQLESGEYHLAVKVSACNNRPPLIILDFSLQEANVWQLPAVSYCGLQ